MSRCNPEKLTVAPERGHGFTGNEIVDNEKIGPKTDMVKRPWLVGKLLRTLSDHAQWLAERSEKCIKLLE